jgi:hypothetical protein
MYKKESVFCSRLGASDKEPAQSPEKPNEVEEVPRRRSAKRIERYTNKQTNKRKKKHQKFYNYLVKNRFRTPK